jgi:hypothetical protein
MGQISQQIGSSQVMKSCIQEISRWSWPFFVAMWLATELIAADAPRTAIWDGNLLVQIRADRDQDGSVFSQPLRRLQRSADAALVLGPYSVMQKQRLPPSGDRHDYLSFARYWWPDPQAKDGLPYICRDGISNEELVAQGDRGCVGAMGEAVETLALAGFLLEDKRYSDRAAVLVRAWFLDPATRMNPHVRFGQGIPGIADGRGWGILDTRCFISVLDAVRLLEQGNAWTEADSAALSVWMRAYLEWLRTSEAGKEMQEIDNNHGTWYSAQSAAIALYVGDRSLARQIVEESRQRRIAESIEPDGRQPAEIVRTKALTYSVFNLAALGVLARIGESVDVDLWGFETSDGRGIRRGLDFITPPLLRETEWEFEQIERVQIPASDALVFCAAARRYDEPRYFQVLQQNGEPQAWTGYASLLFAAR